MSFLEAVYFEQVYLVFIITKLAAVVVHSNQCALAFYWVRIILRFIMRLTPEHRLQIVQLYYENHGSVRATYRALRQFYGAHNGPSERLIRETMNRFTTKFSPNDNIHPVRRRTVRTPQTIAAVQESVEEDANVSVRRRAQQLHLSRSTLWTILQKDLGPHPYRIQLVQKLKPNDHHLRRTFAEWAKAQIPIDPQFQQNFV